jgi:hypothetical protein
MDTQNGLLNNVLTLNDVRVRVSGSLQTGQLKNVRSIVPHRLALSALANS